MCHNLAADTETPISLFMKLEKLNPVYLLESVEGGERVGRYSFIGLDPFLTFKYYRGKAVIFNKRTGTQQVATGPPMELIEQTLAGFKLDQPEDYPPFFGGLVGYLGYEFIHYYENIKHKKVKNETATENTTEKEDLPDCYLVLSSTVLIYDHVRQSLRVVILIEDTAKERYQAQEKLKQIEHLLEQPVLALKNRLENRVRAKSNLTKSQFIDKVKKAKEYIKAGDIFQVVLSQQFQVPLRQPPFTVYRNLRSLNPSPYLFYLSFAELKIIGSSPEMLVKVNHGELETRPIAGTRPRGKNNEEDARLAEDLLANEKEKAEHVMLVDLGRNDLGKVAATGSVEVSQFMEVEKYSHVMHLVSSVKGKLAQGISPGEALISCFPAGTVSGAPKVRALEIIEELEPTGRGVYAGAILYYGLTGNLDSCIAIRTIVTKGDSAYVQAGAGIVYDSCPEAEYLETCNKAKALLLALGAETGAEISKDEWELNNELRGAEEADDRLEKLSS
jgi:anthranilate synthase component 1